MQHDAKNPAQRPPRVLVVSQHFWPENFRISDIVAGFVESGVQVDVLCGLPNYPKGEWFEGYKYSGPRRQEYLGAQVFRSGEIRRKNNTSLRIFLNYVSFPFFALFNLPRLRGRKYDAVFCYETSPVMMMLPAIVYAKLHRVPLTTYVLDLWPDNLYSVFPVKNKFLRGVAQKVSNWHYRRCNRLIAMSDELAARLHQITGTGEKMHKRPSIAVIPQYCEDYYALDIQDTALAKKYEKDFVIVFAGNFSPAQDLENLVRAVKLVHASGQTQVKCLLVGDGMSRESLEEYCKEQEIQHAFEFCGSCPPEEVPRWTGIADALFAGLAASENLGLTVPGKIPSYFAAGRPMLVAADGEAGRVSLESGAALVSPAGNTQALANNISLLAAMPAEECRRMGEAGRRVYYTEYRRELLLDKLKSFTLEGAT